MAGHGHSIDEYLEVIYFLAFPIGEYRPAGESAIAARVAEHALYDLVAPIQRVTGYDTVVPLYRLENEFIPSIPRIVDAAVATMEQP